MYGCDNCSMLRLSHKNAHFSFLRNEVTGCPSQEARDVELFKIDYLRCVRHSEINGSILHMLQTEHGLVHYSPAFIITNNAKTLIAIC